MSSRIGKVVELDYVMLAWEPGNDTAPYDACLRVRHGGGGSLAKGRLDGMWAVAVFAWEDGKKVLRLWMFSKGSWQDMIVEGTDEEIFDAAENLVRMDAGSMREFATRKADEK